MGYCVIAEWTCTSIWMESSKADLCSHLKSRHHHHYHQHYHSGVHLHYLLSKSSSDWGGHCTRRTCHLAHLRGYRHHLKRHPTSSSPLLKGSVGVAGCSEEDVVQHGPCAWHTRRQRKKIRLQTTSLLTRTTDSLSLSSFSSSFYYRFINLLCIVYCLSVGSATSPFCLSVLSLSSSWLFLFCFLFFLYCSVCWLFFYLFFIFTAIIYTCTVIMFSSTVSYFTKFNLFVNSIFTFN